MSNEAEQVITHLARHGLRSEALTDHELTVTALALAQGMDPHDVAHCLIAGRSTVLVMVNVDGVLPQTFSLN